jgi:hypothetical protein
MICVGAVIAARSEARGTRLIVFVVIRYDFNAVSLADKDNRKQFSCQIHRQKLSGSVKGLSPVLAVKFYSSGTDVVLTKIRPMNIMT